MPAPVHVVKGKTGVSLVKHHATGDVDKVPLGTAAMATIVAAAFLLGNGTGVVFSPDASPSPTPDWQGYIDDAIVAQMADHLEFDHQPDHTHEVTPSPTSSATPTPSPTSATNGSPSRTTPTASPRATPRATPRPTPRSTSTPTDPPAPSATPCFRPGKPHSSHDPCNWPPDG